MSSERTSRLERLPTQRLPLLRRPATHGPRRRPTQQPHVAPLYTLAIHDAPVPLTMSPAVPAPAHTHPADALRVEVIHRVEATESAVTLLLAQPGTHMAPAPYLPGQFTTLALTIDGETHYRSYSLCGDGSLDWPWEITIKRSGLASSILCDEVTPGMVLRASPPRGAFTLPAPLDPARPLIFVAAGSGITPIYGMLRALACLPPQQRPHVQLHYAAHAASEMIFARELAHLDPGATWLRQWHYLSSHGERLTPERLLTLVERDGIAPRAARWYICTPEGLKQSLARALHWRRVSPAHVHMEVFASPKARVLALSEPLHVANGRRMRAPHIRLRLAESGHRLDVQPGETLLETLERHGYQPSFGCRAGACGECKLRVISGKVAAADDGMLTPAERAAGYVLSCTAQPQGEVTLAGVESPASQGVVAAGASQSAVAPPSHRRIRGVIRLGLLAATIGLFIGAWHLTSPAPLSSAASGASQHTDSITPVASNIGK